MPLVAMEKVVWWFIWSTSHKLNCITWLVIASTCGHILVLIVLGKVYNTVGPRITFLTCIGIMFVGVITTVAFYTRLVVYSVYQQKKGYIPVICDIVSSKCGSFPHFTNKCQGAVSINHCDKFVQTEKWFTVMIMCVLAHMCMRECGQGISPLIKKLWIRFPVWPIWWCCCLLELET